MAPKLSSIAWQYFTDKGSFMAECTICNNQFNFKSSVSNLTKHLKRKHPFLPLMKNDNILKSEKVEWIDEHLLSSNQESSSTFQRVQKLLKPEKKKRFGSEERHEIERGHGSELRIASERRSNSNQLCVVGASFNDNSKKEKTDMCKSDVDQLIMNLFIMDFQPFRIVEDIGFKKLIQSAFPFYIIPPQNYFANNLLPLQFETLRNSKMIEVDNYVRSISITADICTYNNDPYLTVTGHYINENDCELKSVLLDCVLLDKSHTSADVAKKLLQVTEEWSVSEKILIAISDNDTTIKTAMIELGWEQFDCYVHRIDLAVNKGLTKATELVDLIRRVKTAVAYIRKTPQAWKKIERYQEQAGKTAKRLLQCVNTKWNSILYMLQRFLELEKEITRTLLSLRVNSMFLNEGEWELCRGICNILELCDEVTKEISSQKNITGGIVIPITIGLIKALEDLDISSYQAGAQQVHQGLLAAIRNNFNNLDDDDILTTCTFLDPRFKLYFENQDVAEATKQRVIDLVKTLVDKEDDRPQVIHVTDQQEIILMDLENDTVESEAKSSLVWQHYNNEMKVLQPKGSAAWRAVAEVQRYLDDRIVLPSENITPLDWWKKRKDVYPHLYSLVVKYLNAMATNKRSETLSSADRFFTDKKSKMKSTQIMQLLFLCENSQVV